jgi:hypothetical protein
MNYRIILTYILFLTSGILGLSACAVQAKNQKINLPPSIEQDAVLEDAKVFVRDNLFSAMIHVWSVDRQSWNDMLGAFSCGTEDLSAIISKTYQANHPLFSQQILQLASVIEELSAARQQEALELWSRLAFGLFSVSYAQGYTHQIRLADKISPGIHADLCGGRTIDSQTPPLAILNDPQVTSTHRDLLGQNNGLQLHKQFGYQAFETMIPQIQGQLDALVYSHAYQQPEAYQALFFEVNKFENTELYGQRVEAIGSENEQDLKLTQSRVNQHNEFAYLLLTSGYHWGMMSVLVMLEEEYPRLHDLKKRQGNIDIKVEVEKILSLHRILE